MKASDVAVDNIVRVTMAKYGIADEILPGTNVTMRAEVDPMVQKAGEKGARAAVEEYVKKKALRVAMEEASVLSEKYIRDQMNKFKNASEGGVLPLITIR